MKILGVYFQFSLSRTKGQEVGSYLRYQKDQETQGSSLKRKYTEMDEVCFLPKISFDYQNRHFLRSAHPLEWVLK